MSHTYPEVQVRLHFAIWAFSEVLIPCVTKFEPLNMSQFQVQEMFGNMKNVSLPPSDFMFLIRIPCDSFGKMKDLGDCLRAKGIAWIVGWTVAKDALGLWVWIVAWVGTGVGSTAENDGKADWALSFSVVWGLVFWGIFCWGLLALPLCLMVTLCGFLLAVLLELMKEWVVKTEELTIIFPNLPYMAYRTRAIITRSFYIFYPLFECQKTFF